MLSRREFNLGLGVCGLYLLTGCDSGSQSRSQSNAPVVSAAIDIAAIFWSNPVVKLLRFLKVISTTLDQIRHNENLSVARFDTTNPGVVGAVDLTSSDENAHCHFSMPRGDIYLSPAHFMRVNNISFGDDGRLDYVDNRLLADFTQCTDYVLNSGEGDQIKMLNLRSQCFESKGYGQVNLDYIRVKHENHTI